MVVAGFCTVPLATLVFVCAWNVMATEPPPGMEKVPHEGVVAPGAGSTTAVRVAPPASAIEVVER
ncbi:MAG: hypothetical protein IPJ28_18435 [Betaproteobacteria bacterium]|nr:hypothetical protein [Betaproteobacteria bacterium]